MTYRLTLFLLRRHPHLLPVRRVRLRATDVRPGDWLRGKGRVTRARTRDRGREVILHVELGTVHRTPGDVLEVAVPVRRRARPPARPPAPAVAVPF